MWCHNKYQTGISQVCNLYSLAILRVSFTTAKLGIDSCLSASRSPSGDMLIHRRCWYDEYPLPLDTWRADIYEEGGVPGSTMTQTFQQVAFCLSTPPTESTLKFIMNWPTVNPLPIWGEWTNYLVSSLKDLTRDGRLKLVAPTHRIQEQKCGVRRTSLIFSTWSY